MDVLPIQRTAVSDAVFGQLVEAILSGRIAADEALPGERDLAESFGVNRHAVREGLKRVQQVGLVRISQGGKTRALDWRTHAGIDVLSALASSGTVPPARLIHDIAEMRRSIAADAARLCATAASPAQREAVIEAAAAYAGVDTDLAFWTAVIDGSGNLAYRLGLNTLVAAFTDIGWDRIAELGLDAELVDARAHQELARVIADGDADAAYSLAHDLLSRLVAATRPEE